jgi:hypothetical protein
MRTDKCEFRNRRFVRAGSASRPSVVGEGFVWISRWRDRKMQRRQFLT